MIFLRRSLEAIGVKLFSAVDHCAHIAFIVKIPNNEEENFGNITCIRYEKESCKYF